MAVDVSWEIDVLSTKKHVQYGFFYVILIIHSWYHFHDSKSSSRSKGQLQGQIYENIFLTNKNCASVISFKQRIHFFCVLMIEGNLKGQTIIARSNGQKYDF